MSSSSRFAALRPGLCGAIACLLIAPASAPGAGAAPRARAKVEIKIATIAPEGSTWMNIMDDLDAEIRERTAGEAGLKFYPGGIQGDETVVLRKIRAGQLHGGGFTGVGLGEIAPALRVMEIPFLFRDLKEFDAVQKQMEPVFEPMLQNAGWELLGWADVGFVYLFAKEPIRTTADLRRVRMWLWEGDPLAESFLENVGVAPVPLPITDVVTSLQTGLIDAVYTSPYACIALQWFTRLSTMTDLPVSHASGAVVISKEIFEKLSPAARATVKELAAKHFQRLAGATAKENDESIRVLREKGITVVSLAAEERKSFEDVGRKIQGDLAGKLYPREVLDQVLAALQEARAGSATAK